MKKIIALSCLIFALHFTSAAEGNLIWGEAGYILDADRIRQDHEGALPDTSDGDAVDELDRWLTAQSSYLNFTYRFQNIFEFGSDFTVDFGDPAVLPIDNLVKTLYLNASPTYWFNLTVGRQRLKWGTARVFNAIDKLESVNDPFNNRQIREGVTGIKIVLTPLYWLSISLLGLPEDDIRWTRFAGRLDLLFLDIDLGLGAIKYNYANLDSIDTAATLPAAETTLYDRVAIIADAIRYFGDLGVYTEFEYHQSRENEYACIDSSSQYKVINDNADFLDEPVIRLSSGLTYTFSSNSNFILEYFYNSAGYTDDEAVDFNDSYNYHMDEFPSAPVFIPGNFGNFGSFRKHYLCQGITDIKATEFLSLGYTILANLETLAFDFAPQLRFDINNSVFISLKYHHFTQFRDEEEFPSELNYLDINNRIELFINTNFVSAN